MKKVLIVLAAIAIIIALFSFVLFYFSRPNIIRTVVQRRAEANVFLSGGIEFFEQSTKNGTFWYITNS